MNNSKEKDPITEISMRQLVEYATRGEVHPSIKQECLILDHFPPSRSETQGLPFRLNACIIGVGIEGECTFRLNLKEYRLRRGSLIFLSPSDIMEEIGDTGFRAHLLIISIDMMKQLNIDLKTVTPLLIQLGEERLNFPLEEQEIDAIRSYLELIAAEVALPEQHPFTFNIVNGLIMTLVNKIGSIMQHYIALHPESARVVQNRAEEYFRNFIRLLVEHYKQERSVGFYARKLCITPKYLTTIIKRVSHRSVTEWIDIYVIMEAKTLLKYTEKSIQEIAFQLNFPNQSFFGCYFKRITGMSPSQYRAQQ